MVEDRNNQSRFGGEYMIQDSDHMSEIPQSTDKANRGVRQAEQSHSESRQQGGDQGEGARQGGGRRQSR